MQGYIVTAFHFVNGANGINLLLQDGSSIGAKLVTGDIANDLAVLSADSNGKPPQGCYWKAGRLDLEAGYLPSVNFGVLPRHQGGDIVHGLRRMPNDDADDYWNE